MHHPDLNTDLRNLINMNTLTRTTAIRRMASRFIRGFRVGLPMAALTLWMVNSMPVHAAPSPPERMSYQGYLVDADGTPLAAANPANYPVVFRVYAASQGGDPLWTEQQIVTVNNGNFSVILGEGTQFGSEAHENLSTIFTGASASDRYIGITVDIGGTQMELLPRLRLLASPYAFLATNASSLVQPNGNPVVNYTGGNITLTGNTTTSGTITAGSFSGNGSALTELNASQLTSGVLDSARLPTFITGARVFSEGLVNVGPFSAWEGRLMVQAENSNVTQVNKSASTIGTWFALSNTSAGGRHRRVVKRRRDDRSGSRGRFCHPCRRASHQDRE